MNREYYFPILYWRNNYENELEKVIFRVRSSIRESPIEFQLVKSEEYVNYCICCYRWFKYSTNTTLEYNRNVGRCFVRGGGYGSHWETFTFGFFDRNCEPDIPENVNSEWTECYPGHEICDLCILTFLEDQTLKVVRIESLGDVTPDIGTFFPSDEFITDTCGV